MNLDDRRNAIDKLTAETSSLSTAIGAAQSAGRVTYAFLDEWNTAVVAPLNAFATRAYNHDESFWESGDEDTITAYQKTLAQWRDKLAASAGAKAAPPTTAAATSLGDALTGAASSTSGAIGSAAGGGWIDSAKKIGEGIAVGVGVTLLAGLAVRVARFFKVVP